MNKTITAVGIVLIFIAIILFAIQYGAHVFSIYDSDTTKYGYYGGVGVIGLIGLILAAYGYMKNPTAKSEAPT
jgi:uncharacterized membrane protein